MDTTRIGIMGYGAMGSNHAGYIQAGKIPGACITAVCDADPQRLDAAKSNLGADIACYEDPQEFFASAPVDGVMICTPHYQHPPLAIQAFEKGLHVLIEKPAGSYTKQVREMNEAAEQSGKCFAIMFQKRQTPVFRKLKDIVASGEIGEVMRTTWIITSWFRTQSYYDSGGWRATWEGEGGGVLLNQCPHQLDLWQWIVGEPSYVNGFCHFGKWHNIEVEDDVTAYVSYDNGATGVFIASTGEAPGSDRLEIAGDRGLIVLEHNELSFYRTRQSVSEANRTFAGGFAKPECWKCQIPVQGQDQGHAGITRNWVEAIREGKELIAPGTEGIKSLQISNAILLSSWLNEGVELPLDEDLFYSRLQKKIENSTFKKETSGRTLDMSNSFA